MKKTVNISSNLVNDEKLKLMKRLMGSGYLLNAEFKEILLKIILKLN
ncbi:hypothetical protein JYT51_01380 [Candidatus Amoebophilus asiaticus]|nr:hypothetical protein [Candidatus Amoebophilus asiaticus]